MTLVTKRIRSVWHPAAQVLFSLLFAIGVTWPLVNGYLGHFPTAYEHIRRAAQDFPDEKSMELLGEAGARYIVVDKEWLAAQRSDRLHHATQLQMAFADENAVIYRLFDGQTLDSE